MAHIIDQIALPNIVNRNIDNELSRVEITSDALVMNLVRINYVDPLNEAYINVWCLKVGSLS